MKQTVKWLLISIPVLVTLCYAAATNVICANKVARIPYLGSTLESILRAIPTVTNCTFVGNADIPMFTDEAIVTCQLQDLAGKSEELQFNLLGSKVYPATARTKYVMKRVEERGPQIREPLHELFNSAPDNTTCCIPSVLDVGPLKSTQ